MLPPAARAIAWEFRSRHRISVVALGAYLAVFGAIEFLLGEEYPVRFDPPNGMAAWIMVPVASTFFYFVGLFSHGFGGDLAAHQSIYPPRLFTLPVTTRALAGWPMLYGTTAMASLWLVTTLFARFVAGAELPLVWPAFLMAAYLAWTQAFMWMPYGLRGLRVLVAVLWLVAIDAVVLVAIEYEASELRMMSLLAPLIPLAYVVACVAVARARRGDVPDWSGPFAPFRRGAGVAWRGRRGFSSPIAAQTWYEWRRHGRTLPALVGLVVPAELGLLFIPGNDTAPVVFTTLAIVLLTPLFLAVVAAPALSTSSPFGTTRPMTTASLVRAKLTMTVLSTLAAWILVLVCIPLALSWSGTLPIVIDRARAGIEVTGIPRAVAVVLCLLVWLVAGTWKRLVQSLCVGLTARDAVVKSTVGVALVFLVAAGPIADLIITNRNVESAIWRALPWILSAVACLKVAAGAWVAVRLYDTRVLSDRALVIGAVSWLATVLAVYGMLEWFAASPLMPRFFLAAIAIVSVPLARISAAPLALAWSRHR